MISPPDWMLRVYRRIEIPDNVTTLLSSIMRKRKGWRSGKMGKKYQ